MQREPLGGPPAMLLAMLLFSTMGACVKLASAGYGAGEIVLYRSVVSALLLALTMRRRGQALLTPVLGRQAVRSLTGAIGLGLFFVAIGGLPLATAITLNYTSSLWMAFMLACGALLLHLQRPDARLVLAVLLGFAGAALILRPTLHAGQAWFGLAGLASGVAAAASYLQTAGLRRAGEPEERIVFYYSLGGIVIGSAMAAATGWHEHTPRGVLLLLAVGVLAAVAQTLLTRAYASGNPLVSGSLQYSGIVFSSVFGLVLFDDALTWQWVAGVTLIAAAGTAATWLSSRRAAS